LSLYSSLTKVRSALLTKSQLNLEVRHRGYKNNFIIVARSTGSTAVQETLQVGDGWERFAIYLLMSAFAVAIRGKADMGWCIAHVRF
jgi:hypothetical protein